MLSVPIHKDFTEYRPKLIGGATARTVACLGAAVGCAVAASLFMAFVLHMEVDTANPLIWVAAAPAAAFGFYQPHGMKFEEFLPLWFDHNYRNQLIYYKTPLYRGEAGYARKKRKEHDDAVRKETRNAYYARLRKEPGIEIWSCGELPDVGRAS